MSSYPQWVRDASLQYLASAPLLTRIPVKRMLAGLRQTGVMVRSVSSDDPLRSEFTIFEGASIFTMNRWDGVRSRLDSARKVVERGWVID